MYLCELQADRAAKHWWIMRALEQGHHVVFMDAGVAGCVQQLFLHVNLSVMLMLACSHAGEGAGRAGLQGLRCAHPAAGQAISLLLHSTPPTLPLRRRGCDGGCVCRRLPGPLGGPGAVGLARQRPAGHR